jgi:rRNA maturation endonuclease Nob1
MGSLDRSSIEFEGYEKRKKRAHLYLCEKCVRSFETDDDTKVCKFCGSDVKEIGPKKLTRYVCPACYYSISTVDKLEKCQKCGNKIIHYYPVEKMSKTEFVRMRKHQISGGIKKVFTRAKQIKKGK